MKPSTTDHDGPKHRRPASSVRINLYRSRNFRSSEQQQVADGTSMLTRALEQSGDYHAAQGHRP